MREVLDKLNVFKSRSAQGSPSRSRTQLGSSTLALFQSSKADFQQLTTAQSDFLLWYRTTERLDM